MARITDYLRDDHARLHALLATALGEPCDPPSGPPSAPTFAPMFAPTFDQAAFDGFRRGLLRHIAIEEKLVFPAARGAIGPGDARRLRVEHAALTTLLVPTPDRALAAEIASLLAVHDAREEAAGGVYARCEAALGEASHALAIRARAFPPVRVARYVDRPGARRTAREALAAAERIGARRPGEPA